MKLEDLGWSPSWTFHLDSLNDSELKPGRVIRVDRNAYELAPGAERIRASVSGAFRNSVPDVSGFPAVGDWVAFRTVNAEHRIEAVLPRVTAFVRQSAGRTSESQVVAANIDVALLVCGMDQDLNPRRLERYLMLAWASGAMPVVLLNKADLESDPEATRLAVQSELVGVDVLAVSAETGAGVDALENHVRSGRTVALLGSSGAGKSTLANRLLGRAIQSTAPLRAGDGRGRHTTTHRELFLLPGGGILIDTPGLRELQLAGSADSLHQAFEDIDARGRQCRFRDCRHEEEPGCAVREGVDAGAISEPRYANFLKMRRELESARMRQSPHLVRRRDRRFAKLVRRVVEEKRGRNATEEDL